MVLVYAMLALNTGMQVRNVSSSYPIQIEASHKKSTDLLCSMHHNRKTAKTHSADEHNDVMCEGVIVSECVCVCVGE